MQQYRKPRATRSEAKSIRQNENESLKEYFRRVRYLGNLALSEKTLGEKDKNLRDQFLEGLFDSRLQQKLYEDETNRNFCGVLQRAQELELIQKTQGMWTSSETRQHKQTECDFLWRLGARQCGQGQLSEFSRSSRREVCCPADVDGYRGEPTGQAGCNSSKIGGCYPAADEEHEWQLHAADSSNDADAGSDDSSDGRINERPEDSVGGSRWWSLQQQFWAATTGATAITASTKHEHPFRSKQIIRSREFK